MTDASHGADAATASGSKVGQSLPRGTVELADGEAVLLRPSPHRATVLVLPHAGECEACRRYVELTLREARLDPWSATLVTVAPDEASVAFLAPVAPRVALDPSFRRACGVADGRAAVLVADRHGQIWEQTVTDGHTDLPGPDQLEQDVRFIAIQCPECDVPDVPGLGEWA
jgi:hypothetical protein